MASHEVVSGGFTVRLPMARIRGESKAQSSQNKNNMRRGAKGARNKPSLTCVSRLPRAGRVTEVEPWSESCTCIRTITALEESCSILIFL